jgi:hypothetical protein
MQRVEGDRAENLELAVDIRGQVLEDITRQDFPQEWAMTHHNVANAYIYRVT